MSKFEIGDKIIVKYDHASNSYYMAGQRLTIKSTEIGFVTAYHGRPDATRIQKYRFENTSRYDPTLSLYIEGDYLVEADMINVKDLSEFERLMHGVHDED